MSVKSDYLPYSIESSNDNTQLEDDNTIRVITGNRVNWSDNSNLPADWMFKQYDGWSDESILPENWNLINPTVDWQRPLSEGWRNNNPRNDHNHNTDHHQGWEDDSTLPNGWKSKGNNTTMRKDNQCILASKLPKKIVTNH